MEKANVVLKGTPTGITVVMKEEDGFGSIIKELEKMLLQNTNLFKGSSSAIRYKGKKLAESEILILFNTLREKSGINITSFDEDREQKPAKSETSSKPKKTSFFEGIHEGPSKFYRGTLRSGQNINFEGNVAILGDVNPGSEICAYGNIIVMGSLMGMVHAGGDGNREAIVAALNFQPSQLRIADVITRSPDEKQTKNIFNPEIAYVEGEMIYIEKFLVRR